MSSNHPFIIYSLSLLFNTCVSRLHKILGCCVIKIHFNILKHQSVNFKPQCTFLCVNRTLLGGKIKDNQSVFCIKGSFHQCLNGDVNWFDIFLNYTIRSWCIKKYKNDYKSILGFQNRPFFLINQVVGFHLARAIGFQDQFPYSVSLV